MKFLQDLWTRTLTTIDNHPRWVAGAVVVFSLLFHPALTIGLAAGTVLYAYIANEVKN